MLDAIAAVARAVGLENRFENVESNAIGAITYGMKVQLETCFVALNGHGAQFFWIVGENARRRGIVAIGLEHCGGAGAESAIGDGFERAGLEPRVRSTALRAPVLQIVQ